MSEQQNKKILICGDSYCVTDDAYKNVHWSEQLLELDEHIEILNFASGGASNALIALQLLHGLKFEPDFVIISFTSNKRYEYDKDHTLVPCQLDDYRSVASWLNKKYTTSSYTQENKDKNKLLFQYLDVASQDIEEFKNYCYANYCLSILNQKNISFCYSKGGLSQDLNNFLERNLIKNNFLDFEDNELPINLWNYGQLARPYFHVDNPEVHRLFANECLRRIKA